MHHCSSNQGSVGSCNTHEGADYLSSPVPLKSDNEWFHIKFQMFFSLLKNPSFIFYSHSVSNLCSTFLCNEL
jgi:hypothetical protein